MTEAAKPTVYIVDDNNDVRDALSQALSLEGYATAVFGSAEDFRAGYRDEWRGCLLLDIRLGETNGLDLQAELMAQGSRLPIVFITGHGDAASARAALKAGAADYLEKPIGHEQLLDAVSAAFAQGARDEAAQVVDDEANKRLCRLTPRERQVMHLATTGRHNREIGEDLGISPRTVEVYKARLMEKLGLRNLSELIRFGLVNEHRHGA